MSYVSSQPPQTKIVAARAELADYHLLRRIGAGSYGDVWLARDAVGKLVAVKIIDRERLALVSGSNREERALGLLRTELPEHPHLIRVHHVGNDGPRLYYVMDLADDCKTGFQPVGRQVGDVSHSAPAAAHTDLETYRPRTLADLTAAGPIPVADAIAVVRELLDAVRCLHDHGVVHRDIKPSNILSVGGVWKLADIGLMAEEATAMTTVGTPDFMPPTGKIDRTADLYALGKLLYCLTTGNPARSFPSIPRTLLTQAGRGPLAAINDVITRACHVRPEHRFTSAQAMDDALRQCLRRLERGDHISRWRYVTVIGIALAVTLGALTAWRVAGRIGPPVRPAGTTEAREAGWISLFNGVDLTGWYNHRPFHGNWTVADGVIECEQTDEFKSLLTERVLGAGTVRATIIPGHDGARLGIGYLGSPSGPLFMLMGDKYTWIRGYRERYPPDEPGNWLSFPGPIPQAGERVTMEVEYGPQRVVLKADGVVLQELPGVEGEGCVTLHVWGGDAGGFTDIAFRPARR